MGCGVAAAINLDSYTSDKTFFINAFLLEESKNRGQQATGCSIYNQGNLKRYIGKGLPSEVFDREFLLKKDLEGEVGIGHVRYATLGPDELENAHPVRLQKEGYILDLAMNGEISEHYIWRDRLEKERLEFNGSNNDTSTLAGLLLEKYISSGKPLKALGEWYDEIFDYGGVTVVGILQDLNKEKDYMIYARDGIRPLSEGLFESEFGKHRVFASESSPLEKLGARDITEVPGGTIGVYDIISNSFESLQKNRSKPLCFFEIVYEMRPDSMVWGKPVASLRNLLGWSLKYEHPKNEGSIVAGVPRSGLSYAEGYSREAQELIVKDPSAKYSRIFMISPEKQSRTDKAKRSFSIIQNLEGKTITIVDDSIVRYNNLPVLANLLREKGASEVHARIGSPPIVGPCHSGVDTHKKELIVNQLGLDPRETMMDHTKLEEKLRNFKHPELGFVKLDSAGYLSVDGAKKICGSDCCYGCIETHYPYHFKGMEPNFRFIPVKEVRKTL